MKKLLTSLVAFLLIFALAIPVQASSQGIPVYYNGIELELTEPAFIEKGKTYVPLRSYLEELDFEVRYKGSKKQIIVDWYGYESIIHLDTLEVKEYDEVVIEKLDVIYRNHTYYAPIRELEPITITTTKWDPTTKTIYVADIVYLEEEYTYEGPSEGFLWKVSKDGNTVYMLGSIHVGNDALYPLRDEINDAYEAAEIVVTEVDTTREPTTEEIAEIQKLFFYQDGSSIKDHLSPEAYKALMELARKLEIKGEGLKELHTYQPWFLNMMLSSEIDTGTIEPDFGIDLHFLEKAQEDGLAIGELESYLLQYEMLAGFSDELQEQLLLETILEIEYMLAGYDVSAGTSSLVQVWAEGDLDSLTQMANGLKIASPEYYDGVLTKRNIGMTNKIEEYLNGSEYKTYLVIAGALHYAGEDSIIAMLEKRGYTVERL